MSIQSVTPLTQNGNPYNRSTMGGKAGMITGIGAAYYLCGADTLFDRAGKHFDTVFNGSGVKNAVKGLGKFVLNGGAAIAVIGTLGVLGAKIGRALIDAPINQERRAQADGEAALASKFAVQA